MKRRLVIFLVTVLTVSSIFTACSNSEKKELGSVVHADFNDTTFIKTIKWDSLNSYVDYHILKKGNKTTDSNFHFFVKPIAIYHYYNNKFETINDNKKLFLKPNELKELILVDSFSNRTNFECLLRINTQIGFRYRPDLLQTVIVRAKDMSDKNIKRLITDFRKEIFTKSITSNIQTDTILNKATETVFINIKLKPDFCNLKKIREVCNQLNKRQDVDKAFFTDFFTGPNLAETIYYLKTDKKSSR